MTLLPRLHAGNALFLDFDGTLVDLAPQPDAVHVTDDLIPMLARLHQALGGALAVVSGRQLIEIDQFLAPLVLPVAGEHGSVRREPDGRPVRLPGPDLQHVFLAASQLVSVYPGLLLERKSAAIALHYRHAPGLEVLCLNALSQAVQRSEGLDLMRGKYVLEVKPVHVNKGLAIDAFMAQAPFAGRQPVFAGDDTTDEAGFVAVQGVGGIAIKVGGGPSKAQHRCPSPNVLRGWLMASFAPLSAGLHTA